MSKITISFILIFQAIHFNVNSQSYIEIKNNSYTEKFYTIGSTKEEVLEIQGQPKMVSTYDVLNEETWRYDEGTINFKNGKVKDYSNYGGLKIKIKSSKKSVLESLNLNTKGNKKDTSTDIKLTDESKKLHDSYSPYSKFGQITNTPGLSELQKYDPDTRNYIPGVPISEEQISEAKKEFYYKKYKPIVVVVISLIAFIAALFFIKKQIVNYKNA